MNAALNAQVESWQRQPDERSTIALCELLATSGETQLVEQVGKRASIKFASNPTVLVAIARMYVGASRLGEAQGLLVAAGKMAPRDPEAFRWLGEVLLRRGDAERAAKVLDQAMALGRNDSDTASWSQMANSYLELQKRSGTQAVVAALSRVLMQRSLPPPRSAAPPPRPAPSSLASLDDDYSDTEMTIVRNDPIAIANSRRSSVPPRLTESSPRQMAGLFAPAGKSASRAPSMPPPPPRVELASADVDMVSADDETGRIGAPPMDAPPEHDNGFPSFAMPGESGADLVADSPTPERPQSRTLPPREVLGALQLTGVFEPSEGREAGTWDTPPKTRTRFSTMLLVLTAIVVGIGIGVLLYVRDVRAKHALEAKSLNSEVATLLRAGKVADLSITETKLSQAFDLDPNSAQTALLWVTNRVLRLLEAEGESQGIDSAIARARQTGVPEVELAFARIGSFIAQGDTAGAAALLPQWDGPAKKNAYYQLLAGVALERAGDLRAAERYQLAVNLDPELLPAQVLLARAVILEGDRLKGLEIVRHIRSKWQNRAETSALAALAWARDSARGPAPLEAEQTKAHKDELPVALRAVPGAIDALQSIEKNSVLDARSAIVRALATATTPGVATWLGSLALQMGDEALARRAALQAVSFSAVYPPARVLAARVALAGGRLDEALNAVNELNASLPDVAIVRASVAYERVDPDGVALALETLPADARTRPEMAALFRAVDVLKGNIALEPAALRALAAPEVAWGDVIAIDAALDTGNLTVANELIDRFRDTKDRPPRALRVARHLRYTDRAADAEAPSSQAAAMPTARTVVERILVLLATNKGDEARSFIAKNAQVLGPMASWVLCYIDADGPRLAESRAKAALLDPPSPMTPLLWRVVAALAMGDLGDKKRGLPYVRNLVKSFPKNPDVLIAAQAFRK
ncbi:MAG TPA: tetratricopeptide repeat protein [Polyangiaceae bacterium]|nr:tetratricopeptide repeat protein [Polyangiaceae bacterium]